MTVSRQQLGAAGERWACRWYLAHGYRILATNWRCKAGELDIIAAQHDTVVFCEVKTRTTAKYGSPFEGVTAAKQARIRRLATIWLGCQPSGWNTVRFDVAGIGVEGPVMLMNAF